MIKSQDKKKTKSDLFILLYITKKKTNNKIGRKARHLLNEK